jgi:DNA polymerase I
MDIETTGLDLDSDALVLFQIMARGKVFIIEVGKIGIGQEPESFYTGIQKILENPSIIKVFHNAVFDLKFLKVHLFNNKGIRFNNICDTKIAEQLLTAGLVKKKNLFKGYYSLKEVVKRYTGHELDKTEQTSFRKDLELNEAQVEYAADDVRYLKPVFKAQQERLKDAGLEDVARLEFSIIPAVMNIELRGILLDLNKLEPLKGSLLEQELQLKDRLSELVGGEPVNFSSPPQVKKVLSRLGHPVKSTKKEFLEKINHPFAKTLLEYRKISKLLSSFVEPLPNHINPKTGRIHPEFFQC